MMPKPLKTIATLVASLAATWIGLALVLYVALYQTLGGIYRNQVRDVMQVICGRLVPDALVYTLRPGECRFANAEFDTRLVVDADGFRNDPQHRGSGPARIAVVGDSHAMGWGVAQGEKLSSLLARDHRFEVRDLAMSSYGTAREMIAFTRFAADADILVIQYCDNDRSENAAFLQSPSSFEAAATERARAYAQDVTKAERSAIANGGYRRFMARGLQTLLATWRMLHLPPRTGRETPAPVLAQEAELFARVLVHFRSSLAGKTVLVFDSYPRSPRIGFATSFRDALQRAGLPEVRVLDLSGTLRPTDYFHIDEHMRPSGHAAIATRLLAEIGTVPPIPAPR